MKQKGPVPLPLKHRLYLACATSDGSPIALLEALDDEQAARRAAYLVGRLGISEWKEVELRPAETCLAGVPMFLEQFFSVERGTELLH